MTRFRKADVEFHSDTFRRPAHAAINVKYYGGGDLLSKVQDHFHCSEARAERALEYAFNMAQEAFWEQADEAVKEIYGRYAKVNSEGRCGGWLVVGGVASHGFTEDDVKSWNALALSKWARLVKWCEQEIAYRSSWDTVREDIEANEWTKAGSERYNFIEFGDGRSECVADLKNAHLPKE